MEELHNQLDEKIVESSDRWNKIYELEREFGEMGNLEQKMVSLKENAKHFEKIAIQKTEKER
jgi:hypothetical protein